MALLGEGRDDKGRHPRARAEAVALRWGDMVPPAAVLVEGDDNHHVLPLRPGLESGDDIGDMAVAAVDVRIAGMHVQVALGLVEGHGRQLARCGIGQEFVGTRRFVDAGVAQVTRPVCRAWSKAFEVVERLMMVLEVWTRRKVGGLVGGAGQSEVPTAAVPGPIDTFLR